MIWGFRRRITEGSPKGRRRVAERTTGGDFGGAKVPGTGQPIEGGRKRPGTGRSPMHGGHKCPPAERKKRGGLSRGNRDTHWKGWRGGRKKRKSPKEKKEKAPNKKRETAACGSACLRAAAPPSSLASFLSSFGGCAALNLFVLLPLSLLLPRLLPSLLWAAAPPLSRIFSASLAAALRAAAPSLSTLSP